MQIAANEMERKRNRCKQSETKKESLQIKWNEKRIVAKIIGQKVNRMKQRDQATEREKELQYEKLLGIKTTGRDDSNADQYHYPYEPTPYCVLERLAQSGYVGKKNMLLDYGCGKGRVDFFLSYQCRCRTIGIEYDERIYENAVKNKESAVSSGRTMFVHANAEQYEVPVDVDRCYYFNPFSVEVLKTVLARIMDSYYENPREILLFFYYPSDEYVGYLMTQDSLAFFDEIDCKDLYSGKDTRERILIFEVI